MTKSTYAVLGALALALALAPGCKQNSASAQTRKIERRAPAPVAPKPVANAAVKPAAENLPKKPEGPVVELQIASVGNTMKFDKSTLTVKTGSRVHLVFHSNSTIELMPHDWVLVTPGTEAAVALAGLNKGVDSGYIDPGPNVLAYTPLATTKKQTVEVTFTAPAPGTYPYICTVPGHYMVMNGKLIVTP